MSSTTTSIPEEKPSFAEGSAMAMSVAEAEGTDKADAALTRDERVRLSHRRWFVALRSFAVFIGIWYLAFLWNGNPIQLPSPRTRRHALWQLGSSGELFEHAAISTSRMAIALVVASLLAVPLGFVMGRSRTANDYIDPVVELLRPISGIAWIPLALFIFGVGDVLPVFIMVYVAFFPLLLNTIAGVRNVDQQARQRRAHDGRARLAADAPGHRARCAADHHGRFPARFRRRLGRGDRGRADRRAERPRLRH